MTARMNRVPRWTPMFRDTQPAVHPLDGTHASPLLQAGSDTCPPCRRDETCNQGRCELAARYLERARYASAAQRLVARKLAERRHRMADRAVILLAVVAAALWTSGGI